LDNIKYEYVIAENQHKNYNFLIDETTATRDMHIHFYLERNAVLDMEILIANATVNVTIDCILGGEGASARIMGGYILNASHKVQIVTRQQHPAAHTHSTLLMKVALRDNAYAHYSGTIRVEQEASGAYAVQQNKNILLSGNARAVSVPSLEVLTHDVHCFHGSAIGRFDDEQLFYAASRGIDEKIAQQLFLNAFFADVFTDEGLKQKMRSLW
jgi:Fe-S cluster assembly protein SufD